MNLHLFLNRFFRIRCFHTFENGHNRIDDSLNLFQYLSQLLLLFPFYSPKERRCVLIDHPLFSMIDHSIFPDQISGIGDIPLHRLPMELSSSNSSTFISGASYSFFTDATSCKIHFHLHCVCFVPTHMTVLL